MYHFGFRFSGMLRAVDWTLVTEVSGQPGRSIFHGQAVQVMKEAAVFNFDTAFFFFVKISIIFVCTCEVIFSCGK